MIRTLIPWVTTAVGALIMWLAGRSQWRRTAWYLGVANQFLWATYAITTGTWGFLGGCTIYATVYVRNILKGD